MRERFIGKIKQFFSSEQQEEKQVAIPKQKSSETIKARVSYQYPKNDSFRFPMPIDQPTVGDMERETIRRDRRYHERQIEAPVPSTKRPFKPSVVASPIHGFQSYEHDNEDLLDKPAFLRRDRESRIKDRLQNAEVDNQQDNRQSEPAVDVDLNELISEKRKSQITSDMPLLKEKVQHTETEPDDKLEHQEPVISTKDTKQEQTSRIQEKMRPYNVIMTPSDKRRLREKKIQQVSTEKRELPSLHLLNDQPTGLNQDQAWIDDQAKKLTETLAEFNVNAQVVNVMQGPAVTRFEIKPEMGVKVSKIRNLSDDIKLNMAAKDIRIEAPIPGKNAVGIEIPNKVASPVSLHEIFATDQFKEAKSPLTIGLGLDIAGRPVITNINKMPHGLIAGATGSGKSVCINTILTSIIFKATPREVRLLLIDPKMVELASYNDIPHLVSPVITDVKAATQALKWAVEEMEERYQKFVQTGARDINRYNQKMLEQNNPEGKMPYIVIVIDELADLMMVAPQDVEDSISRIAQKARACGIHLILATQRPSVDVITGLIKANIPTRIAFSVASQIDSRTIIDHAGAERLLGKGDMLFVENGARHPLRVQGAYVSDEEIDRITADARKREQVNYLFEQEDLLEKIEQEESEDELYEDVVAFVLDHNSASTSLLQRRFKIGYNRAARLIDTLEYNGIISGQNGSKPRTVLISKEDYHS
ncbi:DNA translocase FtsK [Amphibacillus xylanus]|uniref:Putative cell division protein FtsK n=1 Tax=Amphibacillus xylanus (strain ATCC 51415 / DSM 6626 / JCM 7361 / LMG 17667 / NBRC 15112 / Ep01) TaxID=698758 RepID=K0J707_AMPXN|nr:DNA translocase FtsK [Amphibacillus xylanus]BAM47028.1 putative cell division protein FtsK [Amphibacillus xylanus NBRC 15112]